MTQRARLLQVAHLALTVAALGILVALLVVIATVPIARVQNGVDRLGPFYAGYYDVWNESLAFPAGSSVSFQWIDFAPPYEAIHFWIAVDNNTILNQTGNTGSGTFLSYSASYEFMVQGTNATFGVGTPVEITVWYQLTSSSPVL